jgi:hypothetical protein
VEPAQNSFQGHSLERLELYSTWHEKLVHKSPRLIVAPTWG